ncbi:hypothetical protein B7H01_24615 [Pandoraea apista]|nr:hypothetical protein B7H01_24615 [Pandoraea apista]
MQATCVALGTQCAAHANTRAKRCQCWICARHAWIDLVPAMRKHVADAARASNASSDVVLSMPSCESIRFDVRRLVMGGVCIDGYRCASQVAAMRMSSNESMRA